MIEIRQIDTTNKADVKKFIDLPYRLYKGHKQWVPPIRSDVAMMLNRSKHPFYEHSAGDFFLAEDAGRVVGRLSVMENTRFNQYHNSKQAQFYLFETENNSDIVTQLFNRAFEWARTRGLNKLVGPKGFGPLDGYGIQVEGYEHRQMMNMMNYNYDYYPRLLEGLGFHKEVDFVSCYIVAKEFHLPERVHRISERVQERGTLTVKRFRSKKELLEWAPKIGQAYNKAFINNWEYYPLTEREISFVVDNIMLVAHHKLIKVINHGDDVVGFLFGFPDVSAAMQRINGRLFPFGIIDLLLEMRRTPWISLNGAGILPQFQGKGGNALLYAEMEHTLNEFPFIHGDLTQVAETAVQMRHDLMNVGAKPYKNHRVYQIDL